MHQRRVRNLCLRDQRTNDSPKRPKPTSQGSASRHRSGYDLGRISDSQELTDRDKELLGSVAFAFRCSVSALDSAPSANSGPEAPDQCQEEGQAARNERTEGRRNKTMKHILLLAVTVVLVFGSSVVRTEMPMARASVVSANLIEVEGVEFNGPTALLKTGYEFQIESSSSLAVLKTSNVARIQTGTITCVTTRKSACGVKFYKERATCGGGCNFVGSRGGIKAR
jgi:hypothetical protein